MPADETAIRRSTTGIVAPRLVKDVTPALTIARDRLGIGI